MEESETSSDSSKSPTSDHFLYDLSYAPFLKQSDEKYIQTSNRQPVQNIIVGGCGGDSETEFHEVFLTKDTTEPGYVTYKSLNKDYNKSNADLKKILLNDAEDVNSFLIDEKYILIEYRTEYNVYDLINDKWLLKKNNSFANKLKLNQSKEFFWYNARSVIINDQFYISSFGDKLYFFTVWNYNRITNLDVIQKYTIRNKDSAYQGHGMCCVGFKYNCNINSKSNAQTAVHDLNFKLLLFGSIQPEHNFFSSFLTLDIQMEFSTNSDYKVCKDGDDDGFQMSKCIVTENTVNLEPTQDVQDLFQGADTCWSHFAYHCIVNGKGEPIIVIFGGSHQDGRSLCLYNTVTKQIDFKSKV